MRTDLTTVPARVGVAEAAEFFGRKKSFVYRLVARGELAHYRLGREITFAEEDLARFLNASRHPQRTSAAA